VRIISGPERCCAPAAPFFPPVPDLNRRFHPGTDATPGDEGGALLRRVVEEDLVPFFAALERSPDAVFVTDRANHVVFWNDAARRMLGFTSDEALGLSCNELLKGTDLFGNRYCSTECPIMQLANRGEVVRHFALGLTSRDRQPIMTDISVLQLRASEPDHYFLVHQVRSFEQADTRSAPDTTTVPPKPHLVSARGSDDARARKLTAREVEVLGMLAAGRSTPEIAERLHISQLTARSHIQNILDKLELHSKAEAVAFAFQKNLI
jgi:DNA-binding CsgD family transcriptional regulator